MRLWKMFAATIALAGIAGAQTAPDYAAWRAKRAQGLTQPYGWFSLVALDTLREGETTVGSAKDNRVVVPDGPAHLMTVVRHDGLVTVKDAAAGATLGGQALATGAELKAKEDEADAVVSGPLRIWAIDRGGRRFLRVRDSAAPALKNFHGLSWYAPEAKYRVTARWVPYGTPHKTEFLDKVGMLIPTEVPGYVEFELNGKTWKLSPIESSGKRMMFVFGDQTSAKETYGGGRFLYTDAPSNGLNKAGTVVLDFNEAENPPCAYSPFATCPLASRENRLALPVTAGEKIYDKSIAE